MSLFESKARWFLALWMPFIGLLPVGAGDFSDSIDPGTGGFLLSEADLRIAGCGIDFEFCRSYNSRDGYSGPLGPGWTHTYNALLMPEPSSSIVLIKWGDGREVNYLQDSNDLDSYYPADGDIRDVLKRNPNGSWAVKRKDLNRYGFDSDGKLQSIIDRNGNTISLAYDANGLDAITDTAARVIDLVFDANGLIRSITDPNNRRILYGYTNGKLTSITDARGNTEYYSYYTDTGTLRTITDKDGNVVVENKYDDQGRLIEQTDARGKATKYTYNALDQLIDVNDPLGNHTSYSYDANGNMISNTDALGNAWTYEYDASNRRIEEKDPLGNATKYEYDSLGRQIALIDARGNRTQYEYDANDLLVTVIDALGGVTRYEYDAAGNMTAHVDAAGKRRTKSYDSSGRLIGEADVDGNTTTYAHDQAGNLIATTDAADQTTTYKYDELSRAVEVNYPVGGMVTYEYDENDNLVGMTDWNGRTTFEYDRLDRMTASTDFSGRRVEYEYDEAGNRTAIVYPGGFRVSYSYDDAGQMQTITDWNDRVTTYTYDPAGNLVSLFLPNSALRLYGYDDASRLTHVYNFAAGNDIGSFTYTLDPVGNRIGILKTGTPQLSPTIVPIYTQYNYHGDDWLTEVQQVSQNYNESMVQTYQFSDSGNMEVHQHLSQNPASSFYGVYAYGPENLPWHLQRIPAHSHYTRYAQYVSDGLGNRLAAYVMSGNPALTSYSQYVLDLSGPVSQVLYERVQTAQFLHNNYYIYGLGLVAQIDPYDGAEYYYHYDGTGSTVAMTSGTGWPSQVDAYGPFGERDEDDDDDDDDDKSYYRPLHNPFKYAGRFGVMTEWDGTLYMRTRYYHPETGRFFSSNPAPGNPAAPMSLHPYVYSQNNPMGRFDPTATGMDAPLPHMRNKR